ncbi:hypothetical protein JYU29_05245 [Tianweitania sp. BSSL-BM11]|uniref:DUF2069 domain-containing protein n=2 Tax=Tianweitania aestuarii TaxID=2814886 RepID=A0ABS5RUT9_9HYPH|nr:DUF6163 family protein [Tianweitania aestuarii]MBS9720092.1 hypothetical protein [Tianweitania aestuarii]
MSSQARIAVAAPTMAEGALAWLHRLVAVYCLLFGILYWIRLIGLNDGLTWRFDTMPITWQAASVLLAVFFPFAAIGLWMLASWGPVLWLICAITEIVMYVGFPQIYGFRIGAVATHCIVAALYLTLRLVIYLQRKRIT